MACMLTHRAFVVPNQDVHWTILLPAMDKPIAPAVRVRATESTGRGQ
jgi:hypothetical protein